MFLRRIERRKNGKTHLYWSLVENKRLDGGGVVQRHVLYLGEINSSQAEVWRKAIEVFDADAGSSRTLALFPEDRCEVAVDDASVVRLRISQMRLHRPRQWGACWLAGLLWRELQLDRFWAERLPASRKRTRWDHVLQVLVAYRLIEPGSEWRLHREWFGKSAMADLLGSDFGLAEAHKLYACHDLLLAHKDALFSHLTERWRDLFNANFDVLLYDLTSTYFEVNASDLPEGDKRRHGYGRDMRQSIKRLAFVASSLVIAGAAQAHDAWRNGDPIPAWVKSSCCGSSEAHLLSEEEVHHFDGYYIVDSFGPQHIPDSKVLPSQDDAYWGFWNPNSPPGARIMFCFFIPIKASEMTAYPPDSQSPTSMVAHSRSPAPNSAGPYEVSSGLR